MDKYLYVSDITVEEALNLYGPGKRVVVWTSGCSIHCKGCTNKKFWNKENGKKISLDDIARKIDSFSNIRGLTFHGGEPSEQIEEITELILRLGNKYDYILFTGREIESFKNEKEIKFLKCFDVVKCGPFILEELNLNLVFRGSNNQRIIYLSNRISPISENGKSTVIFKIDDNCDVTLQGFPTQEHFDIVETISLGENND